MPTTCSYGFKKKKKEGKETYKTSVLLICCSKQKPRGLILMKAPQCLQTARHQTFKFSGSNFRCSDVALLCITSLERKHVSRHICIANTVLIAQAQRNKTFANLFSLAEEHAECHLDALW